MLGSLLGSLLGFLATIVIVRFLSPHEVGTFKQVFLIYNTISPLFLLALPASLLYFMPRLGKFQQQQFFTQTILLLFLGGLLFSACMLLGAKYIAAYFKNPSLATLLPIFSLYPLFAIPFNAFGSFHIAMDRYKTAAILSIIGSFVAILSYLIPISLGMPLRSVFLITVSAAALLLLSMLIYSRSTLEGYRIYMSWNSIKTQLSYAVPLGLSSILGMLAWNTDRVMVSLFFPPALFAIYAIGAVEMPLVGIVNGAVNSVLVPKFSSLLAEDNTKEVVRIWHEAIRKTSLILLPIFAFLLLFAKPFITFLFTEQYLKSAFIFQIYLFMLPARLGADGGAILQASGKTRPLLIGSSLYLILNIPLNLAFIYIVGLPGPAIATAIINLLGAAYILYFVYPLIKLPLSKLLPWKMIFQIGFICLLSAVIVAPLSLLLESKIILLSSAGLLFLLIFFPITLITGCLRRDDIDLIKRWLLRGVAAS